MSIRYTAAIRRSGSRPRIIDPPQRHNMRQGMAVANGAEMLVSRGLWRWAADGDSKNSPLATALVEHLAKPGLDLRKAFGFVRDDVTAHQRSADPWRARTRQVAYWHISDMPGVVIDVRYRGIVLKNSKIADFENLANDACWRFQPLQCSVESIRAPTAGFAAFDRVPHIAASETYQRS